MVPKRLLLALTLGVLLLLPTCNGGYTFRVGPTSVRVHPQATHVWPDLPEALQAMQELPNPPDKIWELLIRIQPEWATLSQPNHACESYLSTQVILVRVSGGAVAEGCLPHELAHFWRMYETGSAVEGSKHDEPFRMREQQLREAAMDTPLHTGPG